MSVSNTPYNGDMTQLSKDDRDEMEALAWFLAAEDAPTRDRRRYAEQRCRAARRRVEKARPDWAGTWKALPSEAEAAAPPNKVTDFIYYRRGPEMTELLQEDAAREHPTA